MGADVTEIGHYMEAVSRLHNKLAEAQESYRLANQRVIELLDEKIAIEKQCNDLAAALDVATLGGLVNPAQMFEREKVLREALEAVEKWWLLEGMHAFSGAPACVYMVRQALTEPEAKT